MFFSTRKRNALTMVELLIVVAIIGILMAILLPAVGSIRESARLSSCSNNLRQIGMGLLQYESQNRKFPPACTTEPPRHNVLSFILPYLDAGFISDIQDINANWNRGSYKEDEDGNPVPTGGEWPDRFDNVSLDAQAAWVSAWAGKQKKDKFAEWHEKKFPDAPAPSTNPWEEIPERFREYRTPIAPTNIVKSVGGGGNLNNYHIALQDVNLFICPTAPLRDSGYDNPTDYAAAYEIKGEVMCQLPNYEGKFKSAVDDDCIPDEDSAPGLLKKDQYTTHSSIRDGQGNTFMFFERAGLPYAYVEKQQEDDYPGPKRWANWQAGMPLSTSYLLSNRFINHNNRREIYAFHANGANFVYGDGSVRFESEDMDNLVFVNLFTPAGGEVEMREQ